MDLEMYLFSDLSFQEAHVRAPRSDRDIQHHQVQRERVLHLPVDSARRGFCVPDCFQGALILPEEHPRRGFGACTAVGVGHVLVVYGVLAKRPA